MQTVKVLPKGQITIPKDVRKQMGIKVGDTLVIEETDDKVVLKKGKTIFDYAGTLPDIGMSIKEMREKAIEEVAKDRA
ncbi:MAG: hypothetical protein A2106_02845 [Planctomycetes bacterium GWF2_40_8]|nr:MAG: hypothetical protein A2106_02845 [Planctomycetes bacterium GWF2_40_8]OHB89245.1 MAG: hypothetical protein A3D13_02010 [Planctomycetes bacterium RIFCSPHIGHO2_02_FULL_40_12]OHC01526.1 MAG: hypothetical protein A3H23_00055 [Planctomycetes bacterium RIFCSPLOWO2_12_FULL_40_19]